jgi:hypothetical protein
VLTLRFPEVSTCQRLMRSKIRQRSFPGRYRKTSKKWALLSALLASSADFSHAHAEKFVSTYAVRFAGLPMGDAVVQAALEGRHYKVAVSADVGVLFINEKVRGEASGMRTGAKLTPEHFWMRMSGTQDSAVDIRFEGTAATNTKISPPLTETALKKRVPLQDVHLRGVLDPLSALLATALSAPSSSNPCDRVLPVFTGQARFDISFRPKAVSQELAEPSLAACQVRLVAIAGHMRGGGLPQDFTMEVAFIKLSRPNLWTLQHLSMPMPIGTVTVDRATTASLGL